MTTIITEFVKFQGLETTTDEQLVKGAEILNDFQKSQDGFIDGELVKNIKANEWCLVYHYESFEKLKAIGEKMRANKVFDQFTPLIVPESLAISFHQQLSMVSSGSQRTC